MTDANLSISGATETSGALKVGDVVTATWNNKAAGDNYPDIAGVIVNFSQFGGGVVTASNSSGTWTATYTIVAGSIDAANKNISVTATDDAENFTTTAGTTNATVDDQLPVVTDVNLSINGATGTGGFFKVGDIVTAAWNNTSGGENNPDITGVVVNFSQFGGSAVAASNSSGTWTATYTIVDGSNIYRFMPVQLQAENGGFRTVPPNGVAWVTKLEIPKDSVPSKTSDKAALEKVMDDAKAAIDRGREMSRRKSRAIIPGLGAN